ncbi:MAG: hemerythrin family protein [Magnetococcus sp. DMHC-1]|nr:hemerythrin family protein [Magnetococcales bacterium]
MSEAEQFRKRMSGKLPDVGVLRLNRDHKKFLEHLIKFHELVERLSRKSPTENEWIDVKSEINFLGGYASAHFKDEEELMLMHGFPGTVEHTKEHNDFLKRFGEYQNRLISDHDIIYVVDLKFFLLEWFYHHVNLVDVKYGVFFKSIGIK